jgi:ABC-type glycerol-3-phosphate transport system substrate-binding protein
MSSTMSRRALLRGAAGLLGTLGAASLLSACGSSTPAAKPAETKPVESKPAEAAKPAAPAAQPAATTAPAKPVAAEAVKPAAAATAVSKKLSGTLRLHLRTGPEEDTMNAMLPAFQEATGVEVKVETFPTNEYFTKVQTLIAGGTAGDVMWGIYRTTPRLAQGKVIMQLDDLAAKDKFDFSAYWPAAIEACKYQGGLWGLPFKIHPGPSAIYYNVTHANEAGITMPEKQFASWDELMKAAKAMTRDGRFGYQLNLSPGGAINTPQPVLQYLRSWGTELFSPDGKKSLLNEPKAKDAIKFMYDLMHTEKVAVTGRDFTETSEELMIAGRTSMLQAASSTKSIPTKVGGKFEVKNVIMPPGPAGVVGTQAITDHININAKTQNPDAAWELAKFMCNQEFGVRLGGGTGGTASGTTGAMIAVFNDPRIMANPLHPIFIDLVKMSTAPIFPANLREEEHAVALHQTLMPIWLGERKPDDAFFDELSKACQAVLDQPTA